METYLEFHEQEVPSDNPNPRNDVYKNHNAVGSNGAIMIELILGIVVLAVATIIVIRIGKSDGGEIIKEYWWWCALILLGPCLQINSQLREFYYKYSYRKQVLENGVGYPGVVVDVIEYRKRNSGSSGTYIAYKLTVRYKNKVFIHIVQQNPEKYLENPYCTVYEFGKKVIAADFKVKEQYITEEGELVWQ